MFQDTSQGQEVLDTVFRHLNLLETAYFGLRYLDAANQTVSLIQHVSLHAWILPN